jgi:fibronectin-binding autotransporter adhesin
MDMSARTSNTMTLDVSYSNVYVYGNWINGSGTTITTAAGGSVQTDFLFLGQTTQTITTANISFGNTAIIVGVSSTLTLVGNLSVSGSNLTQISLNSSSVLNLNGYTFSCAIIYTDASTIVFNGGTLELTGSGIVSDFSGSLTTTPGTGAGTINLTSASAKTFSGNNQTFNCTLNQGGSGQLTVTGANTFTNVTNSVSPTTVLFSASTTNIFTDFSLAGTAGNLVTVGSTSSTRTNLSKTSGVVSGNFLSISNTNATGGATWYAVNSTNGGNNLGWQFAASDSGMMLWF